MVRQLQVIQTFRGEWRKAVRAFARGGLRDSTRRPPEPPAIPGPQLSAVKTLWLEILCTPRVICKHCHRLRTTFTKPREFRGLPAPDCRKALHRSCLRRRQVAFA